FNWEPRTEPVTGKLFGFQPALVHMQPFIEEIALPGIRALGEAANSSKDVLGKLHEAMRFRVIGDVLLSSTRYVSGPAIDAVMRRYPFGIRDETVKTLVEQANESIKFLTQSSRVTGLMIGLALVSAMDFVYYIGPGHSLVTANVDDKKVQAAIDLAPLLFGNVLTTVSIKMASKKAL